MKIDTGCGEHSERYCGVKKYIGCDSHARYSVFVSMDEKGKVSAPVRVEHQSRDLRDYLAGLEEGTPVSGGSQRRVVLVCGRAGTGRP